MGKWSWQKYHHIAVSLYACLVSSKLSQPPTTVSFIIYFFIFSSQDMGGFLCPNSPGKTLCYPLLGHSSHISIPCQHTVLISPLSFHHSTFYAYCSLIQSKLSYTSSSSLCPSMSLTGNPHIHELNSTLKLQVSLQYVKVILLHFTLIFLPFMTLSNSPTALIPCTTLSSISV